MRIKKDDTVVVITGKDKGKTGKVLKAMPKENKVVVQGVNMQTKHAKATQKGSSRDQAYGRPYRRFQRNVLRYEGKAGHQDRIQDRKR